MGCLPVGDKTSEVSTTLQETLLCVGRFDFEDSVRRNETGEGRHDGIAFGQITLHLVKRMVWAVEQTTTQASDEDVHGADSQCFERPSVRENWHIHRDSQTGYAGPNVRLKSDPQKLR